MIARRTVLVGPVAVAPFARSREGGFVHVGGLISYSARLEDSWRRAARLVAKILQGANPAEVPVKFPSKLILSLNLTTARALGIALPQSILFRADEVIE